MRLFVAVYPGERFVQQLTTVCDQSLRSPDLRWTRPGAWHLTLQFLGEWPPDRLGGLDAALQRAAKQSEFKVSAGPWGTFPARGEPRVLFLHLAGGGQLARLAAAVRENVERDWPEGPQDRRPFKGHLTLARGGGESLRSQLKALERSDLADIEPFPVAGFRLMSSVLDSTGARHRKWGFYPLRKNSE